MRVEDFNDLWMKELNSWQKGYFPHLKEQANEQKEENLPKNIISEMIKPYIQEEDEIIYSQYPNEYKNSNKILIFLETPTLNKSFNVQEAITIANYSLEKMGLNKNVIFTRKTILPKGIIIIGNNGSFFEKHHDSIYELSKNNFRFSTSIKFFYQQDAENADGAVVETSTTFPPDGSKFYQYDLGVIRLDLVNACKKGVYANENDTENLAFTLLHIIGHNSTITHSDPNRGVMRFGSELGNFFKNYNSKLTDIMYGKYASASKNEMEDLAIKHKTEFKLKDEDTYNIKEDFAVMSNESYITSIKNYFKPKK